MDVVKVKEVAGTDIFFDTYTHKFMYWDNGKPRTSIHLDNLIKRLTKK
jgi:hypothetical protein